MSLVAVEKNHLQKLELIRADRSSIWNFDKIFCSDYEELSMDLLLFFNYMIQNQTSDLLGYYKFDMNDFLEFTSRSRSTLFNGVYKTKEAVLESEGKVYEIKNSLEYILYFLTQNSIANIDTVYEHIKGEKIQYTHIKANYFLSDLVLTVESKGKRSYLVKFNKLFLTSILRQYSILSPSDFFNIRGKKNSFYPLFTLLLKETMRHGQGTVLFYGVLKKVTGVNIEAYSARENIIRTKNKINGFLDSINELTSLKFSYTIDNSNNYHIKFEENKNRFISDSKKINAMWGAIQATFLSFLDSKNVTAVIRLNEEERKELMKELMINYEVKILGLTYKYKFIEIIRILSEKELSEQFVTSYIDNYLDIKKIEEQQKRLNK